jgi:hypothetical protein
MLSLALAIVMQTRFVVPTAGLATAALASPRPRECRSNTGQAGLWLRLRNADAQRYCELLAHGYARLGEAPAEALSAAQAAQALAGPRPAVRLLLGRAQLRLGQSGLAFEQFAQAEGADTQAFVDPKALHDYARAASLSGKSADALRLYRLLASRVALFDDAREALFVQIEAAAHVLAYAANGGDEALGYLTQAQRRPLGLSRWIDGLRLLAQRARPNGSKPSTLPSELPRGEDLPLIPAQLFPSLRGEPSEFKQRVENLP